MRLGRPPAGARPGRAPLLDERNHRAGGQVAVVIQAQAALKRPLGGDGARRARSTSIARLDAAQPFGTVHGRQMLRRKNPACCPAPQRAAATQLGPTPSRREGAERWGSGGGAWRWRATIDSAMLVQIRTGTPTPRGLRWPNAGFFDGNAVKNHGHSLPHPPFSPDI